MIESEVSYSTDFLWKVYMKYEYTQKKKSFKLGKFISNIDVVNNI